MASASRSNKTGPFNGSDGMEATAVQPNIEKLKFRIEVCQKVQQLFENDRPVTESIEKYLLVLQPMLSKKDYKKAKLKDWGRCNKLTTARNSLEASQIIARSIDEYTTKLSANPKEKWACTLELMQFLGNKYKHLPPPPSPAAVPSTSAQARGGATQTKEENLSEEERKKKVEKLERKLKRVGKVIKEIDEAPEADENWADEVNSPYLRKTRLVDKYMEIWKELCKVAGAIRGTGRPVQKVVHVRRVTRYPEIDKEAEKLLNSKGVLFSPDYPDILKLVTNANYKHRLYIAEIDIPEIATELFQEIVQLLKRRRARDLEMGLDFGFDDEEEMPIDPAERDPELAKKLEENVQKRKTEAEILRKYTLYQEEIKAEPREVIDNDPDASAPEEDDESEDEALEVEVAAEEDDPVEIAPSKSKRKAKPEVTLIDVDDDEEEADASVQIPEESPPVKRLRSSAIGPPLVTRVRGIDTSYFFRSNDMDLRHANGFLDMLRRSTSRSGVIQFLPLARLEMNFMDSNLDLFDPGRRDQEPLFRYGPDVATDENGFFKRILLVAMLNTCGGHISTFLVSVKVGMDMMPEAGLVTWYEAFRPDRPTMYDAAVQELILPYVKTYFQLPNISERRIPVKFTLVEGCPVRAAFVVDQLVRGTETLPLHDYAPPATEFYRNWVHLRLLDHLLETSGEVLGADQKLQLADFRKRTWTSVVSNFPWLENTLPFHNQ